jgi:hypothetical protein
MCDDVFILIEYLPVPVMHSSRSEHMPLQSFCPYSPTPLSNDDISIVRYWGKSFCPYAPTPLSNDDSNFF